MSIYPCSKPWNFTSSFKFDLQFCTLICLLPQFIFNLYPGIELQFKWQSQFSSKCHRTLKKSLQTLQFFKKTSQLTDNPTHVSAYAPCPRCVFQLVWVYWPCEVRVGLFACALCICVPNSSFWVWGTLHKLLLEVKEQRECVSWRLCLLRHFWSSAGEQLHTYTGFYGISSHSRTTMQFNSFY